MGDRAAGSAPDSWRLTAASRGTPRGRLRGSSAPRTARARAPFKPSGSNFTIFGNFSHRSDELRPTPSNSQTRAAQA